MNKLFISILLFMCHGCTPIDYQYYVNKGDILAYIHSNGKNTEVVKNKVL